MAQDEFFKRLTGVKVYGAYTSVQPTNEYGFACVSFHPLARLSRKGSNLEGIETISAEFLDQRLTSIQLLYDNSVKWNSIDEFTTRVSEVLGLPDRWERTGYSTRRLTGEGFVISAELYSYQPRISVFTPQYAPVPAQSVPEKRSQIAPLMLMLAAGVVIGLLVTYIFLRPATSTSSQLSQNQPAVTPTNIPQTKTREAAVKPSPTKAPTPSASKHDIPRPRWFVMLGTFASYDRAGANARLEQMRSEGFRDAYIVDTNSYSNVTPDKLAVVLGPYSENEARRIGGQVRFITPTIKPGW